MTLVRQHASVKCFITNAIIYLQDKTVFVLFFLYVLMDMVHTWKKAWFIYKFLIVYYRQDIWIVTFFTYRHCNAVKLSLRGYLLRILLWFTQLIFGGIYTVASYEPYSWLKNFVSLRTKTHDFPQLDITYTSIIYEHLMIQGNQNKKIFIKWWFKEKSKRR